MAVYTYPNLTYFVPSTFELGLRSNVIMTTSAHNGSVQTFEMPGARWVANLSFGTQNIPVRSELEAFWAQVRGQVNRVALWHFARPTPRGTLTQTGITNYTLQPAGASTLAFQGGTVGQTLKAGDMFSVNSELKMVVSDATFDGSGRSTITFSPALRAAVAANAAITLVRPTANFVMSGTEVMLPYEGYNGGEFSVDLVEVFT